MILFPLQSACVDNPCDNNSTCQSGFTDKGYRCLCTTGFKGPRCKKGNPCHVEPVVSSILRDRTIAHANRDTMGMEISAVRVTFLLLCFLS